MAQSAVGWQDKAALPLEIVPRLGTEIVFTRRPKAAEDGAGLLGVISDAAQQVRVQTARADAAEARFAEADARHRRIEEESRAVARHLHETRMRAEAAERRADELERHLKRAGLAVLEAETRLAKALAEARAERERCGEIQRGSSDTVERMRALLNETEDRLRQATRAG